MSNFNFQMTNDEMVITKVVNGIEEERSHGLHEHFTLSSLEENVSKLVYTGQHRARDKAVEDEYYFPVMVKSFEDSFFNGKILDERSLIDVFVNRYFIRTDDPGIYISRRDQDKPDAPRYRKDFIIGRLLRSYPSFIRDMHFHFLCVESDMFDSVYYSYLSDVGKHDSILTYEGQPFGIRLLVNTARSNKYLDAKDGRHAQSEIPEISVGIDFGDEFKHGDIYLYGMSHLQYIKKQMEDHLTIR